MTRLNHFFRLRDFNIAGSRFVRRDLSIRGATLGMDATDAEISGNMLNAAAAPMALRPLLLTAGQAKMRPIISQAPREAYSQASLRWNGRIPPRQWVPVYLFPFADNEIGQGVTYPNNALDDTFASAPPFNFPANFLFEGFLPLQFSAGIPAQDLQARWPLALFDNNDLSNRGVMYVSSNEGVEFYEKAEALFEWGPEDGLENGAYTAYIGTFTLEQARGLLEAHAEALNNPQGAGAPLLTNFALNELFATLQSAPPPKLRLEFYTAREDAQYQPGRTFLTGEGFGTAQGLSTPEEWGPESSIIFGPGLDGNILYGNSASGGWRAQPVRVTENYLALRIRNEGPANQLATFTHVILAPRRKTPGRINVNTVENRLAEVRRTSDTPNNEDKFALFNAMLGLPGVVDVALSLLPLDDPVPPFATKPIGDPVWPAAFAFADDTFPVPPLRFGPGDVQDTFATAQDPDVATYQLSAMAIEGRPEHPDGRYYKNITELALDQSGFVNKNDVRQISDFLRTIYPLSNEADPERRFDEVLERFGRSAQLLTTQSNIFEIMFVVQSGYGTDMNNDGKLNYRSSDEFFITGETRGRAVYERRTPAVGPDLN